MKRSAKPIGRQSANPEALLQVLVDGDAQRANARCRHFGACGGCQLQDIPYRNQLDAKERMLTEVLQRAGLNDLPPFTVHSADPWQYRNRARMRVNGADIGYTRRASHDFLPVEECPIISPLLWHTAATLRDLVRRGEARWPAGTASFEIFIDAEEQELQLAVQIDTTVANVDRDAPANLRTLCDRLKRFVPQLAGAGLSVAAEPDPSQSRRVQSTQRVEIARWGEPALDYQVDGRTYHVTRNAFFQVNRYLTAEMVEAVAGSRSGALAFDLFAGAGLFSVPLSERFSKVIAVEIGEPAASDLLRHLHSSGSQHIAVRTTALEFLQRSSQHGAPDLIVLDPPRAGLGQAAVQALIQKNAPEVVYVSCDAGSFARDARPLVESGYALASLHLFDLFPQTFHTETIATFQRR